MPLSYAHSQGDGSNRLYDVPCEYLSKAHVTVRVDGTLVPFSWIDTYRLQTSTAPPAKSVVEVRRTTPREDRLVTFTDGSTLVQSDLNTSTLQSFFLAQEAFDQGAASMAVTEDGQFSALQRRITSLADPVNGQDAVTKSWALSAANTNLTAAVAAKDASVVARQGSETARSGSEVARAGAEAARDEARAHRDTASAHRLNAQNAQAGAETARAGAEAAKVGLEAARDTAVMKAGEAGSSAAAALKSAQDAALFDPSSYYTKSVSDEKFLTALTAQNDFYTKAYIGQNYYTKTAIDAAINNKFDKTGGTLTGNATISTSRPTLNFSSTTGNRWSIDAIETDNTFRVVDLTAGARVLSLSASGALWTKQLGDVKSYIDTKASAAQTAAVAYADAMPKGIGDGQTWQNVSRGLATYQNATGKPIQLYGTFGPKQSGSAAFEVSPDGSSWTTVESISGSEMVAKISIVIPTGGYYRFRAISGLGNPGISVMELR